MVQLTDNTIDIFESHSAKGEPPRLTAWEAHQLFFAWKHREALLKFHEFFSDKLYALAVLYPESYTLYHDALGENILSRPYHVEEAK